MLGASGCIFAADGVYVLEVEDFLDFADWATMEARDQKGLTTSSSNEMPVTMINVPKAGEYTVWACGGDMHNHLPGSRSFKVIVNDTELGAAGNHGKDSKDFWHYKKIGKVRLNEGKNFVALKRVGSFTRPESIIFAADDSFTPSADFFKRNVRLKHVFPSPLSGKQENIGSISISYSENPTGVPVYIENAVMRLGFIPKTTSSGRKTFVRSMEIKKDGKWFRMPGGEDEFLFMLYEPSDPGYSDKYYSEWKRSSLGTKEKFQGKTYEFAPTDADPYSANKVAPVMPESVSKKDANTLEIKYSDGAVGTMSFADDKTAMIKMSVELKVKKDGFYSLGFQGFNKMKPDEVKQVQLPPLFQRRALMDTPQQIGNRMTSHPLVIIQGELEGALPYTNMLVADEKVFPFDEWSVRRNSHYGFSLRRAGGGAQTVIFRPVLGGRDSEKKAGETLSASWYVVQTLGDWAGALELANTKVFQGGNIFREPYATSFSDATANVAAYMKDEDASGWCAHLKGRWNIEAKYQVTHSAPLAELEIALLTNDEDYYRQIALPTVEFILSRTASHFTDRDTGHGVPMKLVLGSSYYGADYVASIGALLGDANPWVDTLLEGAMPKADKNWLTLFGVYLARPSESLLKNITDLADPWIESSFHPGSNGNAGTGAFVNVSFYPQWWYLNDLYEVTKNEKYLKYAEYGAFNSLASMWNYPTPPQGDMTIYKGNKFCGMTCIWTRETEPFRLGFDQRLAEAAFFGMDKLPPENQLKRWHWEGEYVRKEKQADALMVSRIGLGIEQPSSYMSVQGGSNMNILHPSWAAEMLGVYKNTGRDIIGKFARHSIVGRFANYPGYYICDFIDMIQDPRYPISGPDVTSIYYHHIPTHFAQNYDFLMAQFELATKDKIKFRFMREKNYVWFVDRIFGLPGKVFFDADCRPMLDKSAVKVSPKVNTLLARAKDGVWVLLLNDSSKDISVPVELNPTAAAMKGVKTQEPVRVYDGDGKAKVLRGFFDAAPIDIPAQQVVAMKIAASPDDVAVRRKAAPIKSQSLFSELGAYEDLGDLHVMRIRGPFGSDSVYAYFTEGAKKGLKLKLVMEVKKPSKQTLVCDRFPFEISVYPLPQDKDIELSMFVEHDDGSRDPVGSFTLKQ